MSPSQQYSAAYAQMLSMAGFKVDMSKVAEGEAPSKEPFKQTVKPGQPTPEPANVKFKRLPFYDTHGQLLVSTPMVNRGLASLQEAQFQFLLSTSQATDIALNRDTRMGSTKEYLYEVQMRFCLLDSSGEQGDEFPSGLNVTLNGKTCPLPNPLPAKEGQAPKRPPKAVNITPQCKLSPILPNTLNVKWVAEAGKDWVLGIWLVTKVTASELLERLSSKGTREPEYTKGLIIKKLNDDDEGIATTDLKVTVACPLGRMRMSLPCRPTTCDHLQCFDASLFIMMNEKKPTWICPVCNTGIKFDDLMIDGYFKEVIKSDDLPEDENDIILHQDGSWAPLVNKDMVEERKRKEREEAAKRNEVCVDLSDSDDDDGDLGMPRTAVVTPPPGATGPSAPAAVDEVCIDSD